MTRKDQSPNVHGWYQTICKKWKRYSQDIRMESSIEKYAMLPRKSGKQHLTDRMKLPNQDKIRRLEENETYN